jgi:hypothetical protein
MAENTARDLLSDPVQISVRFDGPIMQRLKACALRELRSVNAEINYRIRKSFAEQPDAASPSTRRGRRRATEKAAVR